jgi:tetraacyldisaccharide 4'-kinase
VARLQEIWQTRNGASLALLPLAGVFAALSVVRRAAYRFGLRKAVRFPVPVIVIGNLTVGGTGKTPLVIWLAQHLRSQGWRPGLVARGYLGTADHWPQPVYPDSDPVEVGDEAVLLARRTACPIHVGPNRPAAVAALLDGGQVDLVLSDDGLQHYSLGRDLEIVVVDGQRRFGNGWLLPAGPLREPVSRLQAVDLVVVNGGAPRPGELAMQLGEPKVYALKDSSRLEPLARFSGRAVHAVAGIGNPWRFFELLRAHGVKAIAHSFPDHHAYHAADLQFADDFPILMTEKDAVKCGRFASPRHWAVRVEAQPDAGFRAQLEQRLQELERG